MRRLAVALDPHPSLATLAAVTRPAWHRKEMAIDAE